MYYINDLRGINQENSTSWGEKMLLYWLIRELRPKLIVETGTHKGATTMFLAHAAFDNKIGKVVTCDPVDYGAKNNGPEALKELVDYKICKSVDLDVRDIDFLFIDGEHIAEDVKEEWDYLLPRLSKNATVVFHDCWPSVGPLADVNSAVPDLNTAWLPTSHGLRIYSHGKIYQKPEGWSLDGIYDAV